MFAIEKAVAAVVGLDRLEHASLCANPVQTLGHVFSLQALSNGDRQAIAGMADRRQQASHAK